MKIGFHDIILEIEGGYNLYFPEDLKKKLDDYVAEHFSIVMVIHLKQREGLIRARLAGAKAATGDVLIFLDSHVEASDNYLPPLLGWYEAYSQEALGGEEIICLDEKSICSHVCLCGFCCLSNV